MSGCQHEDLIYAPSEHAKYAGYKRATALQLLAATQPSGKAPKKQDQTAQISSSTFPAPLALPQDELAWDPDYDPQSLKSWIDEPERNAVTKARRTVYVVPTALTRIQDNMVHMYPKAPAVPPPKASDIVEYLQAFYHGMPVKLLSEPRLKFEPWDNATGAEQRYIGLNTGSEVIGVRYRKSKDDIAHWQLNLDDLLDAAIAILPSDAYALLMLVEQDLYENDEDDFCCGRAYGGSRVAVVSMRRYTPGLDKRQGVERTHAWPASHCRDYVDACCREEDESASKPKKRAKRAANSSPSVLREALSAWQSASTTGLEDGYEKDWEWDSRALWLSRVCKTASHELGHCFGIDHCVYYACIMQGTAGLSEDVRQPPYLCPVDLAKVLMATGADEASWIKAMLKFCRKISSDRMFIAFGAWLEGRLREIEEA